MSDSFATPEPVAHQSPLSMGFSRQEYQSGFPFHSPGDLPDPGFKPGSPALQADSLPLGCQRSLYVGSHPLSVITWSSREVTWNTRGETDHVTRNMTVLWNSPDSWPFNHPTWPAPVGAGTKGLDWQPEAQGPSAPGGSWGRNHHH